MIPTEVARWAEHGSFCPKMCNHTCPVLTATGDPATAPWALHRLVADLAAGRLPLDHDAARALHHCTGCGACATACLWPEQDVPAQVRAGRAAAVAAGVAAAVVAQVEAHVADGRSPWGTAPVPSRATGGATVTLHVGCADPPPVVDAAVRLLEAAGERVAVVAPHGCCGALLDDLGASAAAADARARLELPDTVVVTDPHCLAALPAATDLITALVARVDRLRWRGGLGPVTYHDPCVLARGRGQLAAPRTLLEAAGGVLHEPEGSGARTVCSGAGAGYDLLEPATATELARRRAVQLAAAGGRVVTACSRAARLLRSVGLPAAHLVEVLAEEVLT